MNETDEFLLLDKNNLRRITIKDINLPYPDLKNIQESKAIVISNWLIGWLEKDFIAGKIKETDLLPKKAELAYHLGVSIGTMQNALRYVEDNGHVESKQCIGTMVCDWRKQNSKVRKLTSKKDISVELIKKYILDKKIKKGQRIPSSRVMAGIIGASANTTRLALENLCSMNILEHSFNSASDMSWVLKSNDFSCKEGKLGISDNETLVKKVEKDLEAYIAKNFKIGDRLPAHEKLSSDLKVSIKTIHDALKVLIKNDILLARRGRYGTTVIKIPGVKSHSMKRESSIFASAQDTAFYNYEKTQNHIRAMIANNYEIGSKLPSISEMSKELDLSPNTIRKALNNLAQEGYLRFERGRYGGTFVMDIPETSAQAFKWLAVNPKYVEVYR